MTRGSDYITANYGSGKICCLFEGGNGSVMDKNGRTLVSLSGVKCLVFEGKGGKDIREWEGGARRFTCGKELGVMFCPEPFSVVVYFKHKNIHAKFCAPGVFKGGGSVEVIQGKEDLFGDEARKRKERVEKVETSHGDFLSAIQAAVAGL